MQLREVRQLFADRDARCAALEQQATALTQRLAAALDGGSQQRAALDRLTAAAAAVSAEWDTARQRAAAHAACLSALLAHVRPCSLALALGVVCSFLLQHQVPSVQLREAAAATTAAEVMMVEYTCDHAAARACLRAAAGEAAIARAVEAATDTATAVKPALDAERAADGSQTAEEAAATCRAAEELRAGLTTFLSGADASVRELESGSAEAAELAAALQTVLRSAAGDGAAVSETVASSAGCALPCLPMTLLTSSP